MQSPSGSKAAPEPLHRREIDLGEHERHPAGLVDADTVLPGQRATDVHADLEDRLGELLRALRLALVAAVVEDERVEVAVAGVEDVADAQPVVALELADPLEHLGQLRARDDAVLDVVVGADPAHRGERRLASLPEERPLGVVGRDRISIAPHSRQMSLDALEVVLDLDGVAVELDDQDRAARPGSRGGRPPRPPRASAGP